MRIAHAAALSLIATQGFASDRPAAQDLHAYNDRYNEIAETYDLDAFLKLYSEAPLWIAPGEPPVAGRDIPAATFGFFAQNDGSLRHSLDHVFMSEDGTQAVMIGTYELDVAKVGVAATGTYLFVMAREGEDWDIVVDMYNQHSPD